MSDVDEVRVVLDGDWEPDEGVCMKLVEEVF